jgi:hypothetical protein
MGGKCSGAEKADGQGCFLGQLGIYIVSRPKACDITGFSDKNGLSGTFSMSLKLSQGDAGDRMHNLPNFG